MSQPEADKAHIQRAELIRTYYSGREISARGREGVAASKPNRFFYRWLKATAVLLMALAAGAATASYFLGRRPQPINISKVKTTPPIRYDSNISYYHYGQLENMPGPIILRPDRSCAAINLGQPRDLQEGVISFMSKGECGKERVAIILRDINRMSNANQDDIILTPVLDNGKWQLFNIRPKQRYLPLDISRVTQVRFEISSNHTEEDNPRARVYIRDIVIK